MASVVVNDVSGTIQPTSTILLWFMGDATSDHTANDHIYADLFIDLTAGNIVPNTSFTIYASCNDNMQGTFQVRWAWWL